MTKSERLRTAERREDTVALRAPQVFPLLGDGFSAQGVTAPLRGRPDSYLGRDSKGRWRQVIITPDRGALVAARYHDWVATRR